MALLDVAGLAVAFAAIAVAPSVALALLAILCAGVLEGPVLASTLTVRELHLPDQLRTQVMTTAASLRFGAYAVGLAWPPWSSARMAPGPNC